jgi:transcriptional regulator with XRE-family HTH domain
LGPVGELSLTGPKFLGVSMPRKKSIYKLIEEADLTMSDIARGCDLSLSYVSRIFSGDRVPRIVVAQKIAKFLGMSLEDFIAALPKWK